MGDGNWFLRQSLRVLRVEDSGIHEKVGKLELGVSIMVLELSLDLREMEYWFLRQSLRVLRVEDVGIHEKVMKLELAVSIRFLGLSLDLRDLDYWFLWQSLSFESRRRQHS